MIHILQIPLLLFYTRYKYFLSNSILGPWLATKPLVLLFISVWGFQVTKLPVIAQNGLYFSYELEF